MLRKFKSVLKYGIESCKKLQRRANVLSKTRLIKELDAVELKDGDCLFLHTRLSTVGYMNESPEWLIDYFFERLGPEGHLFMPTFSSNDYAYKYLEEQRFFDLKYTPSKMGTLTRLFLNRTDVKRSVHPTHSVACFGPKADYFTSSHHLDANPFGALSPFYKFLVEPNAKVLSLGLTMFPMTIFRVFESVNISQYPIPIFLEKKYEYKVELDGELQVFETLAHNPEFSNLRRNMLFENNLLQLGRLKPFLIGYSKSYLLDCEGFLIFMEENFKSGNLPYLGYFNDFEKDKVDPSRLQKTWESR